MEEAVYVIRLHRDSDDVTALPSERRYSASLALGLGVLHIVAGVVSAVLAILALFVETEVNQHATGLWTGIVYVGCGILGVLAYSRWYIRHQIRWFLVGSIAAALAATACVGVTALGVHWRTQRIWQQRRDFMVAPFLNSFNEEREHQTTHAVTANIFLTALFELFWSLISAKIAFDGDRNDEDEKLDNDQWHRRRELVVNANLPPGYHAGGFPDLLCHLTDAQDRFHVARSNPLCRDPSLECVGGTMSPKDKVERFLSQAIEIADVTRTIELEPKHTYGSVVA